MSQDYRVYAPDIIGSAGKSSPTRPNYNDLGYAQWLTELLDVFNIPKANFIGASGGGWLILKLATFAAGRIVNSSAGLIPPSIPK